MSEDDLDDMNVDDILNNNNKKKTKNSGRKGKSGERLLVNILSKRFPDQPFSRTVGSGNRWAQARLTETAKQVFSSDIVCPENFKFSFECKHGYNKINLELASKRLKQGKSGNKLLNGFLKQAQDDGDRVKKIPILCWKKDRKPWLAFLKDSPIPGESYGPWSIVLLEELLKQPDEFFFRDAS